MKFWQNMVGTYMYLLRQTNIFTIRSKQVEFRFITKVNHIPLFFCPHDMPYGEIKTNFLIFLWNPKFAILNPSH